MNEHDDYKRPWPHPHIHPFLNSIPYVYIYLYATENFYEKCVKTKPESAVYYKVLKTALLPRH